LTAASGGAVLVLPGVLADPPSEPVLQWFFWLFWLIILLLIIGYPCRLLQTVLESSAAGKVSEVPWRGNPLALFVQSGAIWVICFLAGPVVPAGIALWYWVQVGDVGLVDRLILGELAAFAVSYWVLALAAVCQRGRLRDANPIAVIDCAHRLGYRAAVAAILAFTLVLTHGRLAVAGAAVLHQTPVQGWLLLGICWVSALFWATFLFRLLGLWCYTGER